MDWDDHQFYKYCFWSSPHLFDDLHARAIDYCGPVRQNYNGMLGDFTLTYASITDILTEIISKDKQGVSMLMNVQTPPAEENFCERHSIAHKPAIVKDYELGSQRKQNSYLIS